MLLQNNSKKFAQISKRHNSGHISSSKNYRPVRERVVARLFYKYEVDVIVIFFSFIKVEIFVFALSFMKKCNCLPGLPSNKPS